VLAICSRTAGQLKGRQAFTTYIERKPPYPGARSGDGRSCKGGAIGVVTLYCAAFKPAGSRVCPKHDKPRPLRGLLVFAAP
jgi:hypothetical protein